MNTSHSGAGTLNTVDEQNGRASKEAACETHQIACKGDCITPVMLHCTLGGGVGDVCMWVKMTKVADK
jgi:hypothetical protein